MTDNVIISIRGRQLYAESSPDEVELVTSGTLKRDGAGGYIVSYAETELTGLEGTTTVLQVSEGQVTLLRQGEVNSVMVFEEGRQHVSVYETPAGTLAITINTRRLRSELDAQGGDIEIQYTIDVDRAATGLNLFHIHVSRPATDAA